MMEQDYVDIQVDNKIDNINNNRNIYEVGSVINVKDFMVEVSGIDNAMFYEEINVSDKAVGYVVSIGENSITVALLKIYSAISIGDSVYSTNTLYTGSFSNSAMGRVVDLFGEDMLSSKKFSDLHDVAIERKTIPIMDRGTVNRPLSTGIIGIDLMYPIGKGQRQLIIGDKRTGKTQIGLDTIINQRGKNVICIYVAIGKTKKEVKNIYSELAKRGALDYTFIISAFNDELPPVISLIPYFALSVAEDYMMNRFDVLVVIDDLKRHAEAYREISLISGKTPGRDAYPADIFYTHSRLLEKGCQHKNGGSITILPIVETKGGDITDYISTNIISITDGQIVLSAKSFQKGEKPAINYGLSVSRLGGAVQDKEIKKIGSSVRRRLLSYLETRYIYELVNMDEMSSELKNQFMEGQIILNSLMQYKFSPKSQSEIVNTFTQLMSEESVLSNSSDNSNNNQVVDNTVPVQSEAKVIDNTVIAQNVITNQTVPTEFGQDTAISTKTIESNNAPIQVVETQSNNSIDNMSGVSGASNTYEQMMEQPIVNGYSSPDLNINEVNNDVDNYMETLIAESSSIPEISTEAVESSSPIVSNEVIESSSPELTSEEISEINNLVLSTEAVESSTPMVSNEVVDTNSDGLPVVESSSIPEISMETAESSSPIVSNEVIESSSPELTSEEINEINNLGLSTETVESSTPMVSNEVVDTNSDGLPVVESSSIPEISMETVESSSPIVSNEVIESSSPELTSEEINEINNLGLSTETVESSTPMVSSETVDTSSIQLPIVSNEGFSDGENSNIIVNSVESAIIPTVPVDSTLNNPVIPQVENVINTTGNEVVI